MRAWNSLAQKHSMRSISSVRGPGLSWGVLLLLLGKTVAESHFEVLTPYEGEIFDQDDVIFEFRVHGPLSGHEASVPCSRSPAPFTLSTRARHCMPPTSV